MTEQDGVVIRPFAPEDRALVQDFFDVMGPETVFFFNRGEINRKFANRYFDGTAENTAYFLAECGGRMVGYVFLWDLHTGVPWLGIAVRDDFKGHHLGRRLIAHAQAYAAAAGKGGILLSTHQSNMRGQMLYERMGFEAIGTEFRHELLYLWRTGSQN